VTSDLDSISSPARVANPEEGISTDELQLAARNHGMPLESLRWDVTPPGLHYLLIHYDIPAIDPSTYELGIDGLVDTPLSLNLESLQRRPRISSVVTLECAGNGRAQLLPRPVSQPWLSEAVGTARWTGTSLSSLLQEAGVADGAVDVVFTGADHGIERGVEQDYQRALPIAEAMGEDVILAYEMNGEPLPPQHGYPLRLVVPGWYGMTNVKWLERIELIDEPFGGYQQSWSYRVRQSEDEEGEPLSRMRPRSLFVPPGIPEFLTRERTVAAGEVVLEGRAWSGLAPIAGVEVSTDAGASWTAAELEGSVEQWAWRGWRYAWQAEPGDYVLCSRARDEAGNEQPLDPPWNLGGYANNAVQRVAVTVTG